MHTKTHISMYKKVFSHSLDSQKNGATVEIHSLSHDGRGITTIADKTTFVAGALPGETVTCKIVHKHSNYNDAQMLELIIPSSERVTPPCEHFGLCGGCSLQHMSVAMQLKMKEQTLLDHLKHFGRVTPENILPPLTANSTGYRRKARLGAKFVIKKDKVLVGFREKASNYLADLEQCRILHPQVGTHFLALRELISSLQLIRHIPQIEVAIGDQDAALVFRHLEPVSDADLEKLRSFGNNYQFHIYLQPNPPAPIHKIWPMDEQQRLRYTLPEFNLEFLFHPLDFTQINLEVNRLMVSQAIQWLDLQAEDTVLDLFCGIGNFTLPIARHVRHVTGIEGGTEMVKRAGDNASHNQITNTEFHAANLEQPDPQAPWMKHQYDKLLLDPPRVGAKAILA